MLSRNEAPAHCSLLAMVLAVFAWHAIAQEIERPASGAVPTTAEVRNAVEKLQTDPNLAPERKTRTLKWKDDSRRPNKPPEGLLQWMSEAFKWIGATARILVWSLIAILVAMFAVVILRQLRQMEFRKSQRRSHAPTHVRDLDIRPESLPDDIGAAALELWERGEHRAALSLLYRGLLSRLVHVYEVPIKQSSTEGDCLQLAEDHLQQAAVNYVSKLIRTWQRAVYGGKEAQSAEVRELCAGFDVALKSAPIAAPTATSVQA